MFAWLMYRVDFTGPLADCVGFTDKLELCTPDKGVSGLIGLVDRYLCP